MQKITKKPLALKMNTMVRKSFAIVLAICILLPSFIATAIAADVTDGFSQKASDSGYFCVDDLEKNSDILIKTDTDAVTFVEDGLQIYLSINTPYIYRDTYIIGAMKSKPIRQGGKWYVPKDFYDQFLCAGNVKVPSIFNGALFFVQEIMTALYENCDGSFSKKLLDAILLPTSMGIGEPHLDMSRVFVETPLTEYPNTLMSEMKRLGIKNPEKLTYGEYAVINGTQSLASAGMAAVTENNPELSGIDEEVANKMGILPIPLKGVKEDCIPTGISIYWCINSQSGDKEKEASKEFLKWLFQSDEGKQIVVNDFGFVPAFNNYDDVEITDTLSKEVKRYIDEGKTLPWVMGGFPSGYEPKAAADFQGYFSGEYTFDQMVDQLKADFVELKK